jgi:hypothetical protein
MVGSEAPSLVCTHKKKVSQNSPTIIGQRALQWWGTTPPPPTTKKTTPPPGGGGKMVLPRYCMVKSNVLAYSKNKHT